MTKKATTLLSAQFHKLTGSRTWLHRVKTPHWKLKHVTLTSDAHLHHTHQLHLTPTSLLLVPGGARLATYEEQLRYNRPHIMVLTAVASQHAHDWDADRYVVYLAADEGAVLDQWVQEAIRVSYERLEEGWGVGGVDRVFLGAWRHVTTVKVKEIDHVVKELGFRMSEDRFRDLYVDVYGKSVGKEVGVEEFVRVMTTCAVREAARRVLELGGVRLGVESLRLGIEECAAVLGWEVEEVARVFEEWGVERCHEGMLLALLFSVENTVVDEARLAEVHDMTQPLNRYLISSSHNTYLVGDQLQSRSRADMYRIVLEKGCRCVEIDVWDGDDGRPIVRHGRTMTSTELLENVLRVIRDHSFSHGYMYPVILSVENHMSRFQQRVAATLITSILGDMLVAMGPEERQNDDLLSPENLKGKILIKAKTGLSVLKSQINQINQPGSCSGLEVSEDEDSEESWSKIGQSADQSQTATDPESSGMTSATSDEKIDPEFAECVYLAGGNRKALTALWKQKQSGVDQFVAASCVSINEKKLQDLLEKKCEDQVRIYNSHGFSRIYPKGTRVDSSNYCPLLGHFLGCQLVALNWQSCDTFMALNYARFLANGGCGYVLSSTISDFDTPRVLVMSIVSAFMLPKIPSSVKDETPDPYCVLKVYDSVFEEDDCCSFKYTTDVVKSNGFAPSWSNSITVQIRNPSLAVMNIKVYDRDRTSDDDVLGHIALPVAYLRTGLRSFPLNTKGESPLVIPGTSLGPALLCYIDWKPCD